MLWYIMFWLFYLFDYFNPFTSAHFVIFFNVKLSNWVRLFNKSLQIKFFEWLFESNVSNPHTTGIQHNVDLIKVLNGVNGPHITYFMLHICFGKNPWEIDLQRLVSTHQIVISGGGRGWYYRRTQIQIAKIWPNFHWGGPDQHSWNTWVGALKEILTKNSGSLAKSW